MNKCNICCEMKGGELILTFVGDLARSIMVFFFFSFMAYYILFSCPNWIYFIDLPLTTLKDWYFSSLFQELERGEEDAEEP